MGWLNIAAPTTASGTPVERTTRASVSPVPYSALFDAGERLLAALAAEERRSGVYPSDITEAIGYLEETAAQRQLVDECANEYRRVLSEFGLPDLLPQHSVAFRDTVLKAAATVMGFDATNPAQMRIESTNA